MVKIKASLKHCLMYMYMYVHVLVYCLILLWFVSEGYTYIKKPSSCTRLWSFTSQVSHSILFIVSFCTFILENVSLKCWKMGTSQFYVFIIVPLLLSNKGGLGYSCHLVIMVLLSLSNKGGLGYSCHLVIKVLLSLGNKGTLVTW